MQSARAGIEAHIVESKESIIADSNLHPPGVFPKLCHYFPHARRKKTCMTMTTQSILHLTLLFAFAVCRASLAQSERVCPSDGSHFSGFNPTFRSGDELPKEGVFALTLEPGPSVAYLVGSRYARGDSGYGGTLTLRKLPAGHYRIFLSEAADLELIQNYSSLPLAQYPGDELSYVASIEGGTLVLQLRDVSVGVIRIAVVRC